MRWIKRVMLCMFIVITLTKGGFAMKLESPAFKDNGFIPQKYVMPGAGGENLSVPLKWSDVPEGTKSFALSIIDIHPIANNWIHWLVINIPKEVRSLEEGASRRNMPKGSVELRNSFGDIGYGGPQPPRGTGPHQYVVTIYALSVEKLDLPVNTTLSQFNKAIEGKVLDKASITGLYER